MERYERMFEAANKLHPAEGEQVLVFCSSNGIHAFLNDLSLASEDAFLAEQDAPVSALLCRWHDGTLDVPSAHVLHGLLSRFPENANASVYLSGHDGIHARPLYSLC